MGAPLRKVSISKREHNDRVGSLLLIYGLFEFYVHRYDICIHRITSCIVTVTQFDHIEALNTKNSFGRRQPDPCSQEIAVEFRQIVIAGIICCGARMPFIRRKVFYGRLVVEPVKWTYRKEGGDLHRYFQVYRVR